ncbi:MAG: phenylalanyl-tRNA synthetase subunit alpha [Bacteroidota bacterium]
MSNEVLEISVNVDEQFDVDFNLVQGLFGFILKIFGK